MYLVHSPIVLAGLVDCVDNVVSMDTAKLMLTDEGGHERWSGDRVKYMNRPRLRNNKKL